MLHNVNMDFAKYSALEIPQIESDLKTNISTGLKEAEVKLSLAKYGANKLKERDTAWWEILIRQFKSSFIYLLIAAAVLAFLLREYTDGVFIVVFVLINSFLGFFQEYRSEQYVKILNKYIVASAKVVRDGVEYVVLSTALVVGDIVKIESGDIFPADLRIFKAHDLNVDESALTGESVNVIKTSEKMPIEESQLYKSTNIGFSGTHIMSGIGEGIVIAVGKDSQVGKISHLAASTIRKTVFEKETTKISKFILKLVLGTLVAVFAANLLLHGASANIAELIIFSIALAVSVIPEALPVVTTFSLSSGAIQLAKSKVIVKRLSSIEDLGGIQILCTDKTGTITENKLAVADIYSEDIQKTMFYAALASTSKDLKKDSVNSFDLAIREKMSVQEKEIVSKVSTIDEIPFDPIRRRNSVLVNFSGKSLLIVRGSAEEILEDIDSISSNDRQKALQWIIDRGFEGKRVVALAYRENLSENEYDEKQETVNINFAGLISFIDPIKESAEGAIKMAQHLGVSVKVLTGDSKQVAGAIGYKIGLIGSPDKVILGSDLDSLNQEDLLKVCESNYVFARLSPQQKFKIIQSLETKYETGFLGEGINDAPALKVSNVGIVVNDASDIARESSDVILLQKNLDVIINGIKEGRKVFTNTTKYIKSTLASNFGNFYAVALSTLFIKYLPMLPLQILLLNLLSDFPMISIAGDSVDQEELQEPAKLDFKEFTVICTLLGIVSTCFDLIFFLVFNRGGEHVLQTGWFMGSVLTELVFIYSIRTKKVFFKAIPPKLFIVVLTFLTAIFSVAITFIPFGHNVFGFIRLPFKDIAIVFGLVAVYFITTEVVKDLYYRKRSMVAIRRYARYCTTSD